MSYAIPGAPISDLERNYLNQDPEAGFWRYLRNMGWGGQNPLGQYARRQYDNTYGGFQAFAGQNPNMGFYDYLEQNTPNFADTYAQQSPRDRGGFASAARTRYIRPY